MRDGKLNRSYFKYIEHEMYCYDDIKREIEILKKDMYDADMGVSYEGVCVTSSKNGSTTENAVCRIMTSKQLLHIERTQKAIDDALSVLGDIHRDVFNLKYRMKYSNQQVWDEVPCAESSFYKYRRELVEMVAVNLELKTP